MNYKLNHSRYIDVYAKDVGDMAYHAEKVKPTFKQVKFYKKLYAICKENGIDTETETYARTRMTYALAIDALIKRLNEAGINIHGNDKDAKYVLTHGSDRRGRYYTDQQIVVNSREGEGE